MCFCYYDVARIIANNRFLLVSYRQMGQLFMMGFDGTTVNPQIRSLIEDYHLGSVLLTAKNLKCISPFISIFGFYPFTLSDRL